MIESADPAPGSQALVWVAALSLMVVRGVLLWIAIPLGFLGWLVLTPWLRAPRLSLGQFLGWIDINLIAVLERSVLRPLFRRRQPWTSARDMAKVRHRIGKFDLY